MKAERPHERSFARLAGLLVTAAAVGLGLLIGGAPAGLAGLVLGLVFALALLRRAAGQGSRRRAVLARPFPQSWRRMLRKRYDHFERLPPELRARFEDDVRIWLAEKRITGVELEPSEELRLLVAASAVTLSLGWPEYEWDQLSEVLIYPQDFDRDYGFEDPELAGQAHPWGTVILSAPALLQSFADPDDGYHVGLHEFAHLLDVEKTRFEGIPAGLDDARSREWEEVMKKEMERLLRGKSVLDPYGAHDPVEFLAVAVEAFFEIPLLVRRRHREVYAILAAYFRQDPAAWDDARGLQI